MNGIIHMYKIFKAFRVVDVAYSIWPVIKIIRNEKRYKVKRYAEIIQYIISTLSIENKDQSIRSEEQGKCLKKYILH